MPANSPNRTKPETVAAKAAAAGEDIPPEAYADLPGQDGVEASLAYLKSADKKPKDKA